MNAFVMTDNTSTRIDDLTGTRQTLRRVLVFEITIDESGVVAVRHETDLLRLFLLGNADEVVLSSSLTSFRFRHLTEWEKRARQLRLGQFPEKIRLVFLLVLAAQQFVTIVCRVEFDARV